MYQLSPRYPWNAYVTGYGMVIRDERATYAKDSELHTFGDAALKLNELEERLRYANEAQQRLEWVAAALHGDAIYGPGAAEPLVQQVHALRAQAEHNDCPCRYTTPCQPNCTCVKPFMSHGCNRCARYGSLEQRTAKAEHLAALIDGRST